MPKIHPVNELKGVYVKRLNKIAGLYFPEFAKTPMLEVANDRNQLLGYHIVAVGKTPSQLHPFLNSPEFKAEFECQSKDYNEKLGLTYMRIFVLSNIKATPQFTIKGVVPRNEPVMASLLSNAGEVNHD
jgi:hypothetical protein